ncbi:hypothetical protein DSUL_60118 [Desulfovibrionales bacterium]
MKRPANILHFRKLFTLPLIMRNFLNVLADIIVYGLPVAVFDYDGVPAL